MYIILVVGGGDLILHISCQLSEGYGMVLYQ